MTEEAVTTDTSSPTEKKPEGDEAQETTESAAPALSEDDVKAKDSVVERLAFFFSDANVRQDTFLRKLLMDKANDRVVPLDALLRFNTIKKHTNKPEVLIAAAKELSDTLVVDENKKTISRIVPFTKEQMNDNIPKSLHLENLPLVPLDGDDAAAKAGEDEKLDKKYLVTVDEIREVFEKFGKVVIIKLKFGTTPENNGRVGGNGDSEQKKRKYPLGSAMVEFDTKDGLDKAAEATLTVKEGEEVEPKEAVTFGSGDKKQVAQIQLLSEWIDNFRKNHKSPQSDKKRSRDEKEEEDDTPLPTYKFDWNSGCVIRISGLPEGCDRESLLEAVAKGLDVEVDEVKSRKIYADYSRGQTDGAIRFVEDPDKKVAVLAKKLKDGNIKISGEHKVGDAIVLEGDEEKKYWENFIEFKTKQIQEKEMEKRNRKKQKKGGHGRGGGGRGRRR